MTINQTQQVTAALVEAYGIATEKRHEFLTPEHLLAGFLKDKDFWDAYTKCGRSQELENELYDYLNDLGTVPEGLDLKIDFSEQLQELFETAGKTAASAMVDTVQLHHVIYSFFRLEDSYSRYYMEKSLDCSVPEFLNSLIAISDSQDVAPEDRLSKYFTPVKPEPAIVGRKEEMDKAIRILCRKRKNNVLLVGGRGVGKTTIARGISHLMESGSVPARLKDDMLIELNINALLSGTQYRGDLEGRVQEIMDAVIDEGGLTVYIDELRSLGGAGKMDDSSKDILSLLIPYFKSGDVKFIVSATPEDIKKLESNNAGVLGLFRQIDVEEPAAEETEAILGSLRPGLEEHHGVTYEEGTASHAVRSSQRYMLDRCLPDKAIDLMDEAGAYAQAKGLGAVSIKTIDLALADICKSDVQASDEEIRDDLFCMEERLGQKIYGQNGAIKAVSEAILMSKAGLLDSGKTIGNFLFVGPTGVGKTELSKVLAQQLHVPLHRFDMSEYSEKHSVAKLIGSPAGYVGYDDGGILTDTIRRNPYCVLLLDEIEKAHEDIYNLLLQIMDYAVITDNKGRKADFRNVVLIMTSNAGARYAHKAGIGFDRKADAGSAMAKEVKNVFAPEFINRLTSVVVFNDMDKEMARMILEDKIRKLQERLDTKNIILDITDDAFEKLLKEGFTPEYGARELERVLNARVTPLLMREILFGRKENFRAVITATDEGYALS
ncbi:MAG: AAA family ATPase [Bacteroidales bacterium]|nr:AAA family ATPase [Bacteroidales bacterium]